MKASGIVRKLDDLGRLVIPKEIRTAMGMKKGDSIEMVQINNEVVVRKYSRGCIFCGSDSNVTQFKEVVVCKECNRALRENYGSTTFI